MCWIEIAKKHSSKNFATIKKNKLQEYSVNYKNNLTNILQKRTVTPAWDFHQKCILTLFFWKSAHNGSNVHPPPVVRVLLPIFLFFLTVR